MTSSMKIVKEINENYFIPDYQRGYRWQKPDVRALLDDLLGFYEQYNGEGQYLYCLQPLVVKEGKDSDEKVYRVIDGQQRLTTIYIILSYLKKCEGGEKLAPQFKIKYETRANSESFLKDLSLDNTDEGSYKNIDFFYMQEALKAVDEWFEKRGDKEQTYKKLGKQLLDHTAFIWHKIDEAADEIKIFNNINTGQIKLTNSELIKALLLGQATKPIPTGADNKITDEDSLKAEKRRGEMAIMWENIEHGLNNDKLWYFIYTKSVQAQSVYETRFDIIFDVIANKYDADEYTGKSCKYDRNYRSFNILYEKYKNDNQEFAEKVWSEVKIIYDTICAWYDKPAWYHRIGYIIRTGECSLHCLLMETIQKKHSEMLDYLDSKITQSLKKGKTEKNKEDYVMHLSFDQQDEKKVIRRVLLLHNLMSMKNSDGKFPFDLYEKQKTGWDIEHIHAMADEKGELVDTDNNIKNLALLSAEINRDYKNASFEKKREKILGYLHDGAFIPICTQKVFLKAYTKGNVNMEEWEDKDRQNYVNDICEVLKDFLPKPEGEVIINGE